MTILCSSFLSRAKLSPGKVADFSRNFKKYYNTKDKKMVEAVKLTQQILLGNINPDFGTMETRRGKKITPCKSANKETSKTPEKRDADQTKELSRRLFEEEICASNTKGETKLTAVGYFIIRTLI